MTTAWKNSTATERRAARLAAAERERARRPKPAPKPRVVRTPIPVATDTTGWSEWCEEASHTLCPRLLTCRCPCHDRRAD